MSAAAVTPISTPLAPAAPLNTISILVRNKPGVLVRIAQVARQIVRRLDQRDRNASVGQKVRGDQANWPSTHDEHVSSSH